ncbi:MFS transporter [candidate division KSB1 bacterium]|nr:MFS transporter [candidate division KSB1 bacterium]MBL7094230.1 MFS transporter [candidate division KSB1 bacterium]
MSSITKTITPDLLVSEKSEWKKYLTLATAGHFTNDFYNGFLAPLLPILVVKLDMSLTSAGMLWSIFSISNSLIQPIGGWIADKMKRNYFILIGPILAGVFMAFIGWVNYYWTLLLILCLSGIGTAIFHPQAAALVGSLDSQRKGFSMSIFNTAGAFGVTIGSLIIIPLTARFGLKSTIVTIVPLLIFVLFSVKPVYERKISQAKSEEHPSVFGLIKSNIKLVINLHLIVVIRAILTLAYGGFIPLYLTSKGHTPFFGAVGLAVFQIFYVVGILVGGHIYDKIGSKRLLEASFLFALPFSLAFINLPSIWGFPFLALTAFFLSSSTPVNILMGQQIAPNNASFMSAVMMGLGWGIAGLIMTPVGYFSDLIGMYWTFTIVSFTALLGLLSVHFLKIEKNNV